MGLGLRGVSKSLGGRRCPRLSALHCAFALADDGGRQSHLAMRAHTTSLLLLARDVGAADAVGGVLLPADAAGVAEAHAGAVAQGAFAPHGRAASRWL